MFIKNRNNFFINKYWSYHNQPLNRWWSFIGIVLVAVMVIFAFALTKGYNDFWNKLSAKNTYFHLKKFSQKNLDSVTGDRLEITQIKVKTPIIFDVSGTDKKEYLTKLENGVAHMAGSPRPGEAGNVFIFGHSDYYEWKPGNFKEIFKELDQLKAGDKFSIFYQNQEYKYQVISNKNVKSDDWTIADGPTPNDSEDKTLTIMTCWPPGTLDFRKAIQAKQI